MAGGAVTYFKATLASGAATADFDLSKRGWRTVFLEIPSLSTNAAIDVAGSADGSTYKQIYLSVNTSTAQWGALTIPSSVANASVELPVSYQYIRLTTSAAVADGATFKAICAD